MALLQIEGVQIAVTTKRMQALDQAPFRHLGVEPKEKKILALKSTVHFRGDFQAIAEDVLIVIAPGGASRRFFQVSVQATSQGFASNAARSRVASVVRLTRLLVCRRTLITRHFFPMSVALFISKGERLLLRIVLKNSKIGQRKKSRKSRSQGISAAASLVSAAAGAVIDFRRNDMVPHVVARKAHQLL